MKTVFVLVSVLLSMAGVAVAADTPEAAPILKAGDKAPDFEILKAGQEKEGSPALKLSDLQGKKNVLVAFYPKAFTSGCTAQLVSRTPTPKSSR
jgi:peroxiredoxin Q/BCP